MGCVRDDIFLTLTPAAQVYPASARLMGLLSIMEARAHTVSRLRRDLRALYEASPSPQAWLMAARVEAQLAGGAHRVQVSLFQTIRSCSNSLPSRARCTGSARQGPAPCAGQCCASAMLPFDQKMCGLPF